MSTNKRMFSNDVVDSDRFYDLPFNSQLLYFHLGMKADVKGFVEPKKIARAVGLKIEDLKALIQAEFIIPFESGVVVITHWSRNNNVREDREAESVFVDEFRQLSLSGKGYKLLQDNSGSPPAEIRLDKIRLDKIAPLNIYNQEELKDLVSHFNFVYKRNFGIGKLEQNYRYWRESYSLQEMKLAIDNSVSDVFWKKVLTPEILLRRKNPQGELTDRISQFMNTSKPKTKTEKEKEEFDRLFQEAE